jgi:hypothetical protein
MLRHYCPYAESQVTTTIQTSVAHPVGVITPALAPLKKLFEAAGRFTRRGQQRRRARVLAAAERADAAQRVQAFGRLLKGPS